MTYLDTKPSENICQPLFDNQFNFNAEDQLLSDCKAYCITIIQLPNSPWQGYANLIGYWYSNGQTKISKLQRKILHYLHQWYFSKGNPAYFKSSNLAKKFGSNRCNTIRAITRLVERGILIRLEYWSEKYKRFRSVILPRMYMTLKEKLVFQLEKRIHQFAETDTGGCIRYFSKPLKSLKIQKAIIYNNILYTTYLYTNNLRTLDLTTLNHAAPSKPEQLTVIASNSVPITSIQKGTNNMQLHAKPKRLQLKVKAKYPSSVAETITILKKNDFDPKSIPQTSRRDLLLYAQNKIFKNYFADLDDANDPELSDFDFNSLFSLDAYRPNKNRIKYDHRLFKMLIRLVIDGKDFNDYRLITMTKKIIGWWSGCVKKSKDKNRQFTKHSADLKTKIGFKIYIATLYHVYYGLDYTVKVDTIIEAYTEMFKNAITRIFNYSYVLNLPKKVAFDTVLIDYTHSNRFKNCLTMADADFYAFINSSKRVYQARPESEKSLRNFKQIFTDCFYTKDQNTGNARFEKFKPSFAKFLEILISRIEKYSDNDKRVELSGLKLTLETEQDMPVLYHYMEWLKRDIFSETVFKFDQMFSLENWNNFIKGYMRQERGYSNYWKILDKN